MDNDERIVGFHPKLVAIILLYTARSRKGDDLMYLICKQVYILVILPTPILHWMLLVQQNNLG